MYLLLLLLAVYCNRNYRHSLLLTLVVGLSGLFPMGLITTAIGWWAVVIGFELVKILLGILLITRLKSPIIFLSGVMLVCHICLLFVDNWKPHTLIIPSLELIEIFSCILFSKPVLLKLKGKLKCLLKS